MRTRLTMLGTVFVSIFFAASCAKTVTLKKSAHNVEIADASAVAASRLECDEVEMIHVQTTPNERPENERWSVAEIKARNLGAKIGATHLVWQDKETFPCDRSGNRLTEGTKEAENSRECRRLSAMSYQCMVGRAPPM